MGRSGMVGPENGGRYRAMAGGALRLTLGLLWWLFRSLASLARLVWGWMVGITRPGREFVGRWWRYSFRVPLSEPTEAHEALRQVCGYRLVGGPHRIVRLVPGLRRFHFGIRVVVEVQDQPSRHWTTQWVRWVDDPVELWLIRSAVRGVGVVRPQSESKERKASHRPNGRLDRMSAEEMDRLLGK